MNRVINRAAVIGAGVMGSGIAALLAGAGMQVALLDIVPRELNEKEIKKGVTEESPIFRNRLSQAGFDNIKNPKSGMLFSKEHLNNIKVGNLTDNLDMLSECDWIIEVVMEKLEIKKTVMKMIHEHQKEGSIVSSNTSGVSITAIAEDMPLEFRQHFLGTHFFNPPRYMRLFEMIPTADTLPEIVELMDKIASRDLGKVVVYAKDTPNFIGNRIGVYASIVCMQLMDKYELNIPTVDTLSGPVIGRPKSGSFKLADMVGLDVMCNVADNVLKSTTDEEEKVQYSVPAFVLDLVANGALGNKTKQGFYKKEIVEGQKVYKVYNQETKSYELMASEKFDSIKVALKSANKYENMAYGTEKENKFIWDVIKKTLLYAAKLAPTISDDYKMIDKALVAGFNWELGPFGIWDKIGLERSVAKMKEEGDSIPEWIEKRLEAGENTFYSAQEEAGSYLTVAGSQLVEKNGSAALKDLGDGVLALEFTGRGNALNPETIEMINHGASLLEGNDWKGLVIGNEGSFFCGGADLSTIAALAEKGDWNGLEKEILNLQTAVMALKYARRPVVAVPFGMTMGGGAEVCMHTAAVTPHCETYMGLVEAGVGLVPAGGGCTELLYRAVERCADSSNLSMLNGIKSVWKTIAMATVSTSGFDAVDKGFLRKDTWVVMNKDLLVSSAKKTVLDLVDRGYRPPVAKEIRVLGDFGKTSIQYDLEMMEKGGFISGHDHLIATKIAHILTGGNLPTGSKVNEQYLMGLEREAFLSLCGEEKTRQRIAHMLTTGKPLRN
ncbi:3-hydroxyacyl-CoA dehydrogenase/enoyl-CoA hydratase family protein [Eubacteriaceae bacterium ES3]|nr:3-hydroxyacyl-CoA dehydrogenase/enoyl-CoA hydratase family protein [Eubacteriaceae bacterium ES3]